MKIPCRGRRKAVNARSGEWRGRRKTVYGVMTMSADPSASTEPFEICAPATAGGALVFASPHSGWVRPGDFRPAADLSEARIRSAEDLLVDQLIASAPGHGIPVLCGRVSRAYLDLNRAASELDPALIDDCPAAEPSPKTLAGFGVIPRRAGDGADLYDRRIPMIEAVRRLETVHAPYHEALSDLMAKAYRAQGRAVLIDWHSMPSRAASGRSRGPGRAPVQGVDVVLGDRHGSACDVRLTRRLRALFEAAGWRVGLNQPYAGGYSTQFWGRPDEGFHAIQIELNRALYMDETTLAPTQGFARCKTVVDRVIAAVAADERR